MGTINAGMAAMPHAHETATATGTTTAATGAATTHNHGGKADPQLPAAHDPRFMDMTVGRPQEAKSLGRYVQAGGPGYGGREGENVDNQKDKNEIIDKTDANHLPQYGVLPGQNYVEAIQTYTGLSAIKDLAGMQGFPLTEQDWNSIVALQDRGGAPVLATVNYLTGLTNERPADLPAEIAAKRDAVSNFQVPGAGKSVHDVVIDPKDVSGNNIARSHHSADWFAGYRNLMEAGIPADWSYALAFNDDGTSGSGRFNGFNNQDGNSTGANDGENARFKMLAIASQQLGRPDMFYELLAGGHAHTALDPSVMTDPKINKVIGWNPPDDTKMSPERVEAIRQYYLRPDVQVNQGDFNRHVESLPQSLRSRLDFTGVQFEPQEQNTGNNHAANDNGGNDGPAETPTGAGTGADPRTIGGGPISSDTNPGSLTIDTRPTLAQLGEAGPFPVIDPGTNKLNRRLQDQLMAAFIDTLQQMQNSTILDDDKERNAFVDGAKKGVKFLKDAIAVDPSKVAGLKEELATALADGNLSDAERTSLSEKLAEAGMEDVAASVADGTADEQELAVLHEQVDGAASAKLEKDITAALEDGKLTTEERASIEGRLGKEGLDKLETGIADGTVSKEELQAISKGVEADAKAAEATNAKTDAKTDPKADAKTDAKTDAKAEAGATDAKTGAAASTDGAAPDAKPEAGATDAKAGAEKTKDSDSPKADAPKAEAPKADAPKADAPKADAPKADAPKADAPKADAPKADAPKADAPKAEAPKEQAAA